MKRSALVAAVLCAAAIQTHAGDKHPFTAKGLYSETCSCSVPCACEMLGPEKGCVGVGALQFSGGSYNGKDLTGLKAAYAVKPGDWVLIYVQAASPEQREAGAAFLSAVYHDWGKLEGIKDAKIEISNDGGNVSVAVDDGKIMSYKTKPMFGGDKKTPVVHANWPDLLSSQMKQGSALSCTFSDGDRKFTLEEGHNAYFNDEMDSHGDI